jgi:hypothetical protein
MCLYPEALESGQIVSTHISSGTLARQHDHMGLSVSGLEPTVKASCRPRFTQPKAKVQVI